MNNSDTDDTGWDLGNCVSKKLGLASMIKMYDNNTRVEAALSLCFTFV